MDRKSIFILIFSIAGLLLWFPLVNKLYPPQPGQSTEVSQQTEAENEATDPTGNPGEAGQQPDAIGPAPEISAPNPSTEVTTPTPTTEEETEIVWANEDIEYIFTSQGGGIKSITLKQFDQTTNCSGDEEDTETEKLGASGRARRPACCASLRWVGQQAQLGSAEQPHIPAQTLATSAWMPAGTSAHDSALSPSPHSNPKVFMPHSPAKR